MYDKIPTDVQMKVKFHFFIYFNIHLISFDYMYNQIQEILLHQLEVTCPVAIICKLSALSS